MATIWPGRASEVDVVEHVVAAAPGLVLEVHMAELHLTGGSGQLTDGVLAVLDGGLLVDDLEDTLGTGAGADELEQHHGDHHNGDQNVEDIGDDGGQGADSQRAAQHHLAAEVQHQTR